MMVPPLTRAGVKKIWMIGVDNPQIAALAGIMGTMAKAYGAEIIGVSKVPAGTTDFQQFVLAAQDGGAEGVIMPLGNNEAVQVMQAAQQLGTKLKFSSSLGTFGAKDIKDLGAIGKQMYFNAEIPPATASTKTWPVLKNMTADIASDGSKNNQPRQAQDQPDALVARAVAPQDDHGELRRPEHDHAAVGDRSDEHGDRSRLVRSDACVDPEPAQQHPRWPLLAGLQPVVLQREVEREAVRHRQEAAERRRGARRATRTTPSPPREPRAAATERARSVDAS